MGDDTPTAENLKHLLRLYFQKRNFEVEGTFNSIQIREDHCFEIMLRGFMSKNQMQALKATELRCRGSSSDNALSYISVVDGVDENPSKKLKLVSLRGYARELPNILNLELLGRDVNVYKRLDRLEKAVNEILGLLRQLASLNSGI